MNNETINLPRLISLVANGAGTDALTARRFLHELFAQIEECLVAGETVEVKGIGEFKKGDELTRPVLFRPDARLAEIANEPFSIFTPVELNDGAEEAIAAVSQPEPGIEKTPEPVPAPEPEPEPVVTAAEIPAVSEDSDSETPETEEQQDRETGELEQVAEEVADTDVEEPAPAPAPEYEPETPQQTETTEIEEEKKEEAEQERHHSHRHHHGSGWSYEKASRERRERERAKAGSDHMMWMLLGALLGLILGLVAGYFAGKTMAKYELNEEEMGLYTPDDSVSETTVEELENDLPGNQTDVTEHTAESQHSEEAKSDVPEVKAPDAAEPTNAQSDKTSVAKAAEPVYDTVTANRYLSIIAKDHYGVKNYWVFIYEANPNLGNPNHVKSGTRVLIPAKESFMEATKAETDAKAARLMSQILSKYK